MSATLTVGQAAGLVLAMFAVTLLARAVVVWRRRRRHVHAWANWRLVTGDTWKHTVRVCRSCGKAQRRGI